MIVDKILTENLKTDKEIFKERSKYQVQFFPNGKKAHHIIQSLITEGSTTVIKSSRW